VRQFRIALLPGDGIGVEVMDEAVKLLRAVEGRFSDLSFRLTSYSIGAGEYLAGGEALSEEVFRDVEASDAVLLGAIGLTEVRLPDGTEITPQLDLRERLDLYCGLRPVRLFNRSHTPLKNYETGSIDLLLVRESTEGLFSSRRAPSREEDEVVSDTLKITRRASERLFKAAFCQAARRRRKVTLVDKANVLPSMAFFRRIFEETRRLFPEIETETVYVDAAALRLVQRPESFDVVVTENMFGDILSDLAAGLVGGMGLAPSADIGERHAVFQPAHGSAPDIAGRGIANPVAMILSVGLMLDWLDHPETRRGAVAIRRAVEKVLQEGHGTPDIGGNLSTARMGGLVAEEVERQL
jgi:3-isopropylmalate dehydrogenase